jgi:hypothetical protein
MPKLQRLLGFKSAFDFATFALLSLATLFILLFMILGTFVPSIPIPHEPGIDALIGIAAALMLALAIIQWIFRDL